LREVERLGVVCFGGRYIDHLTGGPYGKGVSTEDCGDNKEAYGKRPSNNM